MNAFLGRWVISLATVLSLSAVARGETVSYTATLATSKGNPVTDVLILESDGIQSVHASVYPSALPGSGTAVIMHQVPFAPSRTLIIGLTQGVDADGNDKTQIIMFLDPDFAAAHAGVPFSSIFAGARHSETIAHLQAAVAGDATELAWFTGTFFSGPAAGAAFATGGPFVVAEFTSLTIIGKNATAGNWMINSFQNIPFNDPNAQSNRATAVVDETAKIDTGPFDIELSLADDGQFAMDKTVVNNTGMAWSGFQFVLGYGVGSEFVPSGTGDGDFFVASLNNREETGAFPNVVVDESRVTFTGRLGVGASAHFVVFVNTGTNDPHFLTLRQIAIPAAASAPAMGKWALGLLVVMLLGIAGLRLRTVHITT